MFLSIRNWATNNLDYEILRSPHRFLKFILQALRLHNMDTYVLGLLILLLKSRLRDYTIDSTQSKLTLLYLALCVTYDPYEVTSVLI